MLLRTMIAAAGFAMLVAGGALAQSKTLATVNGAAITEQDIEFARAEIGEQIANIPVENQRRELLLYLIENELLAAASEKEKLDKGTEAEALLKYYRRRALHDAYFEKKIRETVSDADVKTFYDTEVAKIEPREEVRARHILVKTEDEARDVIERLGRGTDFAELAIEKSTGPTGPRGGDLGYFAQGQMVAEFDEVVFKMKKGDVSDPVKTKFGWHVIKLEDRRTAKPPAFDEVKDRLKSGLIREKAVSVIGELRKSATIDITDPEVKKAVDEVLQGGPPAQ